MDSLNVDLDTWCNNNNCSNSWSSFGVAPGTLFHNVKYAVGTNNSTVEQLVVVMRERITTLESEQQHQMSLQLTYQRVTMTSILESLAQPLSSYALGRLPCVRRH